MAWPGCPEPTASQTWILADPLSLASSLPLFSLQGALSLGSRLRKAHARKFPRGTQPGHGDGWWGRRPTSNSLCAVAFQTMSFNFSDAQLAGPWRLGPWFPAKFHWPAWRMTTNDCWVVRWCFTPGFKIRVIGSHWHAHGKTCETQRFKRRLPKISWRR